MRVLFTRFPLESQYGGAEVQTLGLLQGIKKEHSVTFLGSCPTLLAHASTLIKTEHLAIGSPPVTKWGALSFLWRKRSMRKKLIRAVSALQPQAVFMLSLSEKLLLTDWCAAQGIRVFWVEHDRIGRWLTHNPWLPRLTQLSHLASTITVSDLSRDLYIGLGFSPKHVTSIPNGIDIEKFTVEKRMLHSPFRIGCIARLTKDKGVDVLIHAVASVPHVTLGIIGSGREEHTLRKTIQHLHAQERIHLLPPTENIQEFYKEIDCLILPSRDHDPFGLVIAEAMAAGLPTICTDACGIARHLQGKESIIVPAGSREALQEAIKDVQISHHWDALAHSGPQTARKRFSMERMVDAYREVLNA